MDRQEPTMESQLQTPPGYEKPLEPRPIVTLEWLHAEILKLEERIARLEGRP
jgi:hypothetical protein